MVPNSAKSLLKFSFNRPRRGGEDDDGFAKVTVLGSISAKAADEAAVMAVSVSER